VLDRELLEDLDLVERTHLGEHGGRFGGSAGNVHDESRQPFVVELLVAVGEDRNALVVRPSVT
jgi:hypothetical protein